MSPFPASHIPVSLTCIVSLLPSFLLFPHFSFISFPLTFCSLFSISSYSFHLLGFIYIHLHWFSYFHFLAPPLFCYFSSYPRSVLYPISHLSSLYFAPLLHVNFSHMPSILPLLVLFHTFLPTSNTFPLFLVSLTLPSFPALSHHIFLSVMCYLIPHHSFLSFPQVSP